MTQENNLLEKFHFNEIPPMPRDALEIGDTFAIDANGIFNASAHGKSGGVFNQITISTRRDVCLRTQCERVLVFLFTSRPLRSNLFLMALISTSPVVGDSV